MKSFGRMARAGILACAAILPIGCAVPVLAPANPFAGTWSTAEREQIAFRDDTVVLSPPGAPPTAMAAESCGGTFRFSYGHKTREALVALAPRQPDVTGKLVGLLVQPDYPTAELVCGEGDTTYVLTGERNLVEIYRDRDIAGIGRLTRL